MLISQERTCVGVFFNKVRSPQNLNFIKKSLQHTCFPAKFEKLLRTSPVATSDTFRLLPCNLTKKETLTKMFFCEFCKFFTTFFDRTPLHDCFLSLCMNFEKNFRTPLNFIEHLWETAYFIKKFQTFNQQREEKTILQVFFKHFIQEREVVI